MKVATVTALVITVISVLAQPTSTNDDTTVLARSRVLKARGFYNDQPELSARYIFGVLEPRRAKKPEKKPGWATIGAKFFGKGAAHAGTQFMNLAVSKVMSSPTASATPSPAPPAPPPAPPAPSPAPPPAAVAPYPAAAAPYPVAAAPYPAAAAPYPVAAAPYPTAATPSTPPAQTPAAAAPIGPRALQKRARRRGRNRNRAPTTPPPPTEATKTASANKGASTRGWRQFFSDLGKDFFMSATDGISSRGLDSHFDDLD